MRKEIILAMIIGVLLGGVILYGINLANNSSTSNKSDNLQENEFQNNLSPTPKENNKVSIIFPQNNSVVTEDKITLKGTAKPGSNIAIISENDDIITTTDASGNYNSIINLINGENQVNVTAIDEKLATSSASIIIIRTSSLPE